MESSERATEGHIARFVLAYRSAVYDSTSRSPAEVIFGTEINLPGDLEFGVNPVTGKDAAYTGKESLNELHELGGTLIKMVNDRMKARYDPAANMEDFREELVIVYNPKRRKILSLNLQASWDGPYKIIKRCRVQDTES